MGTPIHPPKHDYWKGSIAKPLRFSGGVKEYNPENWNLRPKDIIPLRRKIIFQNLPVVFRAVPEAWIDVT